MSPRSQEPGKNPPETTEIPGEPRKGRGECPNAAASSAGRDHGDDQNLDFIPMNIRVISKYGENKTIVLIDVGHHDILKKY